MTEHEPLDRCRELCQKASARQRERALAVERDLAAAADTVAALRQLSNDRRLVRVHDCLQQARQRLAPWLADGDRPCFEAIAAAAGALAGVAEAPLVAAVAAALAQLSARGRNAACGAALAAAMQHLPAERGLVVLYDAASGEAEVAAAAGYASTYLNSSEHTCSRTLLAAALNDRRPVLVADAAADTRTAEVASVRDLQLRAVLVAPLLLGERAVGAIHLENRSRAACFSPADAAALDAAGRLLACCLHHAHALPAPFSGPGRVVLDAERAGSEIVGEDRGLAALLATVERVASLPVTVLIVGESGTGKELVARALHFRGARRARPFIAINCAAVAETLAESELFGHERGAFTGAWAAHPGCFEQADGGTLFLDEVNELPLPVQPKLLRVLETGEVRRVGGTRCLRVDVRVVAAASRDLSALVEENRFLAPLFHRLDAVRLRLPPLRERAGDIPALARHFLARYTAAYGRRVALSEEALEALGRHPFPGNVRELENLVRRLVALAEDGAVLHAGDLPPEMRPPAAGVALAVPDAGAEAGAAASLAELRRREEAARRRFAAERRRLVEQAIAAAGGVEAAARELGLNRVTVYRILRRAR